ncbi:MAG TPA: peptidylprolyl isomerase [Kofleriaceae bacterium]|nr:peptidylprolyl isomerase [Kofleriaceae bacterium]
MARTPSVRARSPRRAAFALALLSAAAGCQRVDKGKESKAPPPTNPGAKTGSGAGTGSSAPDTTPPIDIDSKDILARTDVAPSVDVKHVLIGWKGLGRSQSQRTNAEAAKLAQDIASQLKADPTKIDALMKQYSEDPGSAKIGRTYTITPDAGFVEPFKKMGLRLKVNEVGIVRTDFGYHVMLRVTPPPPDPLESADILARPAGKDVVYVQHILIGWKDTPMAAAGAADPRAMARTKADADKLAEDVLAKARGGADMKDLMKQYSEDPGSKDDGRAYPVQPGPSSVPGFTNLSTRLNMGEVGLVKTDLGWHVVKRVEAPPPPPPPAPDPLDSTDILKRQPVTDKAKVKHILLGWSEVHADDDRGKKRTRAELEALVKKTVADLKKGAKIEPLMKELSEDPGSAASGGDYEVTPDAGLVPPFKNLSLRLKVGEVGVVKSQFGIHIIQRTE